MISVALWIRDLRRSESQFGGLEGRFDLRLRFADASTDYQPGLVRSTGSMAAPAADIELPLVMDRSQATGLADELAGQMALQRERARFAMAADGVAIEAGDVVVIADRQWRIVDVSDGKVIRFEAVRAGAPSSRRLTPALPATPPGAVIAPEPDVVIVGAPALPGEEDDLRPLGFAFADPWAGAVVFKGGADADQQVVRGSVERPCAVGRLVSALFPHVSGRWQETSVWVAVVGSAPASASKSAVLNGANRALVETGAGWEMIQFLEAELVDVDTYKLTGLLRGQQGTENAMGAGADIGVRIVFLTGAEQRLAVADWERGPEMDWSAGGWSGRYSHAAVAARPWSPAHLRTACDGGEILLSWVRRAQKDGDRWGAGEPAVEGVEGYRIRVSGGESVREWDIPVTAGSYAAAEQAIDFPARGFALLEVAQLGQDGQPGDWTGISVTILPP